MTPSDPLADTAEYEPVQLTDTTRAARLLSERLPAGQVGAFDPNVLLPILLELLTKLLGCQPTPQQGFAYLTWKPANTPKWLDWLFGSFDSRLANYRNKVNAAIAAARGWALASRDAFLVAMWQAVDAGDLTPELLTGLYSEAKARV